LVDQKLPNRSRLSFGWSSLEFGRYLQTGTLGEVARQHHFGGGEETRTPWQPFETARKPTWRVARSGPDILAEAADQAGNVSHQERREDAARPARYLMSLWQAREP
jgi:hypothetical protein